MIIVDAECKKCKNVSEVMIERGGMTPLCPRCGAKTRRVYTPSGVYLGNQDCAHVRSALSVLLDPDDRSPRAQDLRSRPTRDNLNRYLKEKGLSRLDYTERGGPPTHKKPKEPDMAQVTAELFRRHRERQRLEVG